MLPSLFAALLGLSLPLQVPAAQAPPLELEAGARVAFVGNTFAERLQFSGHFEALLHANWPFEELVVRNLGWSADTPGLQPRPLDFGSLEQHLARLEVDTIFACFGANEAFEGPSGLAGFEAELEAFVTRVQARKDADGEPPELLLVSPIHHEDLGGRLPGTQLVAEHNRNLDAYTAVLRDVAARRGLGFIDLLTPTRAHAAAGGAPLTTNGMHLSESGQATVARMMADALGFGEAAEYATDALRAAVDQKNIWWWYRHRAVNGYYIYGGRKDPFGTVSFPGEMQRLDALVARLDEVIWSAPFGGLQDSDELAARSPLAPEVLDGLPPLPTIETNYGAPIVNLTPEQAAERFTVAEGYRVECFASEVDFPELENPVAMAFDGRGRLWVSTMPTYPQVSPGTPPDDRLLILEDTDGDGRADTSTTFARGLHLAAGFELGDGGAYVAEQPNLLFLADTDGDDRADTRELRLHGFGTEDSHHAISAFTWGPGGGLYFQEGTFHHTQVETPWGPVRVKDGAVFRYEPGSERLRVHTPFGFWNPWGHVFDRWGRDFIGDASDGNNYLAAPMMTDKSYDRYRRGLEPFQVDRVRPTGGAELLTGPMFPAEVQGDYVISNTIGFQGLRAHRLVEDGSGVRGVSSWDILSSSDKSFRPIDLEVGPDGALYFVDWFNPLIGHMQHSLRDPNRDHRHGRIWRVVREGYEPAPDLPIDLTALETQALVELLRSNDDRLRHRVRRELRGHPTDDVVAALASLIAELEAAAPDWHALCEALWVGQHHGVVDRGLLQRLLRAPDERARAAAVRALNLEAWRYDDADVLVAAACSDPSPRVRLEAVAAATRLDGRLVVEGVLDAVALHAPEGEDVWLDYALSEALIFLEPRWKAALADGWPYADEHPELVARLVADLATPDLMALDLRPPVAAELLQRSDAPVGARLAALGMLGGAAPDSSRAQAWAAALAAATTEADGAGLAELLPHLAPLELEAVSDALARLVSGPFPASVRQASLAARARAGWADKDMLRAKNDPAVLVDHLAALSLAAPLEASAAARVAADLDALLRDPTDWPGYPAGGNEVPAVRFVRIELPGTEPLTLAEVQVIGGGRNLAPGGTASQSSVAWSGVAERAMDGNLDGAFAANGQTHTAEGEADSWWELDLGAGRSVESVVIWTRTEGSFHTRLEGYHLRLFDAARGEVWSARANPAPEVSAEHTVATDWRGAVLRGAIAARAALSAPLGGAQPAASLGSTDPGSLGPLEPEVAAALATSLEALPIAERSLPWFAAGLDLCAAAGLAERTERLRIQTHRSIVRPDGSGIFPSYLEVPAGAELELTLENRSSRYANLALFAGGFRPPRAPEPDPAGARLFAKQCASCHMADGGGLVGPNMTDDHYLDIETLDDLVPFITRGKLETGMPVFGEQLTPEEIRLAADHMAALRGTVPRDAKEPQGQLIAPWKDPLEGLPTPIAHTGLVEPGSDGSVRFTTPAEPGDYVFFCTLPGRPHLKLTLEVR